MTNKKSIDERRRDTFRGFWFITMIAAFWSWKAFGIFVVLSFLWCVDQIVEEVINYLKRK